MRRYLILDLDGTLTNNKKEITPKTYQAIMDMQERGHRVILASGRPTPGVKPVAEKLQLEKYNGYLLSYNGGKIIECSTGNVIGQQMLPEDIVGELFQMADQLQIGMMTYNKSGIVANLHHDEYMELESNINHLKIYHYENPGEQVDFPVNKCLGTAPVEIAPEIEEKFRQRFGDRISVSRSEPFFIELVPKGIDKAASLQTLCDQKGISPQDMIACGDGFNDISMIKFAGVGVAMANGQEPVRKAADYITLSNEEDGVAHVIEKFLQ